ncbi:MAG TPA: ATP-binding protein [Opitutaceae bacterium]|nr:ATP-binding protein [Opitutaceae bacterium]
MSFRCFAARVFLAPAILLGLLLLEPAMLRLDAAETSEPGQTPRALHSAAEILAVANWDVHRPPPAHLEGVVTWTDPSRGLIVFQDESGAIGLQTGSFLAGLEAGVRVVIDASAVLPSAPVLPQFPFYPSEREYPHDFDFPPKGQFNYFDRTRGFVVPPTSGEYTFWIAGDDSGDLWLSSSDEPSRAKVIAFNPGWTEPREWSFFPAQQSEPVHLEAGKRYFIESWHVQNGGNDHLSVAWEGPGVAKSAIAAKYLTPWKEDAAASVPANGVLREYWFNSGARYTFSIGEQYARTSIFGLNYPRVAVIGHAGAPAPIKIGIGEALSREKNFRWAEIVGTVSYVSRVGDGLALELADGDKRLKVQIQHWRGDEFAHLNNSAIRIAGVCEGEMDENGQTVAGALRVPSAESIAIVAPAKDWAEIEKVNLSDLASPKYAQSDGQLIRLSGTVVAQEPGKFIELRDQGYFEGYISADGQHWQQIGRRIEVPMPNTVHVGLAVSSHSYDKLAIATFDEVRGLSSKLRSVEIGEGAPPKEFVGDGATFKIAGSGGEIWSSSDQFRYVFQTLEGDGEIVARITELQAPTSGAKGGVMFRENLQDNSPFVDLVAIGSTGPSMQWRGSAAGSRASTAGNSVMPLPYWMKLVRRHATVRLATEQRTVAKAGQHVEAVGYLDSSQKDARIRDAFFRAVPDESEKASEQKKDRPTLSVRSVVEMEPAQFPDAFRLEAVVTFSALVNRIHYLSVQDRSGALLLGVEPPLDFVAPKVGDYIAIETDPEYSARPRTFRADKIIPLGRGVMPKPVQHPTEYLLPRKGEGQWIETDGVVYAANEDNVALIRNQSGFFSAWADGVNQAEWSRRIDSTVRLRGAVAYPGGGTQQLILVPSAASIETLERPPADLATLPFRSIRELLAADLSSRPSHRVRTGGIVTYSSASLLILQDGAVGASIKAAALAQFRPGDQVEAIGFPEKSLGNSITLTEPIVQKTNRNTATIADPSPVVLENLDAPAGSATLVRVTGRVLRTSSTDTGQSVELQAGERNFRAFLERRAGSLAALPEGTEVEATGVYSPDTDMAEWLSRSNHGSSLAPFRLLLRSESDLAILRRPSWWHLQRALLVIGALAAGLLVTAVWIHILRRRVVQRTRELAAAERKLKEEIQISATLAERNRLAGEIHDSLEQGFSGVLLQLDATAKIPNCSPEVKEGLGLAKNMVSFSRAEVHHAVWNLQSPILEESDLGTALTQIAQQVSQGNPRIEINVEGTPASLSSEVEHHLLRIGQEAMTNAVKHASATSIKVRLSFSAESVSLSVSDNGVGFSTENVLAARVGHFGLRSLRSRAKKINGRLTINSNLGGGSQVEIFVPFPQPPPATI